MKRGFLFAVLFVPFVVLATLNSAGYRYGASDQAFYLPAIMERLDPGLFPRDSALIHSQAKLTLVDEAVALSARATGLSLPTLFAVLYVTALGLLVWGALGLGRQLYTASATSVAFVFALTLRHAITRTGTNTLEGYFHPRQLAFALGVISISAYLDRGISWRPLLLLVLAGLVHPTTALWFVVWLAVASFVAETQLRRSIGALAAFAAVAAVWALTAGPLAGRLAPMDTAWQATLASKDYLFPFRWPLHAWAINLAYVPVILWIYRRRRAAGRIAPRERGLVIGCLSLVAIFAGALLLHVWRIALAIQLQPARIFWMLDFLATAYVIWAVAEPRTRAPRRAAIALAIVLLLTFTRGAYIAAVRFPERPFAQFDVRDDDWGRVMTWAADHTPQSSHWLADPIHAARYGTSVRVAGRRDVFVEEIKDIAIGMYDRTVAMRTRERLQILGDFAALTPAHARALADRYALHYLVTEQALDLPLAFTSGSVRVYQLQ